MITVGFPPDDPGGERKEKMLPIVIICASALLMVLSVWFLEAGGLGADPNDPTGIWEGEGRSVVFYPDGTFTRREGLGAASKVIFGNWSRDHAAVLLSVSDAGDNANGDVSESESTDGKSCSGSIRGSVLTIDDGADKRLYRRVRKP